MCKVRVVLAYHTNASDLQKERVYLNGKGLLTIAHTEGIITVWVRDTPLIKKSYKQSTIVFLN